MIYLKGIAAGIVAVFSVAVLLFVGIVTYLVVSASKERGEGASGGTPFLSLGPALC